MIHENKRTENRGCRRANSGAAPRAGDVLCSLFSTLLFLFILPSLGGCMVVGAVAQKVIGDPPVKARYVPAKTKLMLVLVENYRNPAAVRMDAQRLTIHVTEELRRYRVAPVVDPEGAESLRSRGDYRAMKVQEVGRAAGAEQVLYVNLQQFSVENTVGGEMMKGRAEVRVRVVDVGSGQTLWPHDTPEGVPLTAQTPWVRTPAGGREGAAEPALRDQVARNAASQIVKLFRRWRADDEEHELEETVQ